MGLGDSFTPFVGSPSRPAPMSPAASLAGGASLLMPFIMGREEEDPFKGLLEQVLGGKMDIRPGLLSAMLSGASGKPAPAVGGPTATPQATSDRLGGFGPYGGY